MNQFEDFGIFLRPGLGLGLRLFFNHNKKREVGKNEYQMLANFYLLLNYPMPEVLGSEI